MAQLFSGRDDFEKSLDIGINLMTGDLSVLPPDNEDLQAMKALYAVFVTTVSPIQDDEKDPMNLDRKMASLRLTLLTAYNLGREREKSVYNAGKVE